jgi:putative transposase
MPHTRIWIHLVFSTKNRYPYLTKDLRPLVFTHIEENAKTKKISLDAVNGYVDHIHLLIRMKPTQSIAQIAQLVKGESSRWINKNNLTPTPFDWQDEYFALSVSGSVVPVVLAYIENQETHHKKSSFLDEQTEYISNYGFVEENK